MPRTVEPVRAIGCLAPDGPWVGFAAADDGYRLVFGLADGSVVEDPTPDPTERRAGLIAAAIVFYLASLAEPPADLEAIQADVARLIASLAAGLASADERALAHQALDAVDDGLAADAVVLRLLPLLPRGANAEDILRARYGRVVASAGA